MDLGTLFDTTVERGASDLHLVPHYYPSIRVNNDLIQLRTLELLTPELCQNLVMSILNEEQKENLLANKELDFAYEYKGYRYRTNIYNVKGHLAAAFRLIGNVILNIEQLGLPPYLHSFTDYNQGLVLVTGPTGEGKSTTLAALINEINMKHSKHILTIEDPIEYIFPEGKSIVSQRELHQDTHSWNVALKSVLREDPDVVFIGEMRDYDTIQSVLTVAETGHLVFSTLHTGSASQTIDRIIDIFPASQQNQVRVQLASVLRAVVAQRLVPNVNKTKRLPAIEVMINTPSVSSVIRDGRTQLLDNILETGEDQGHKLFEKYLSEMFEKGLISHETAIGMALRADEIKKFIT